jgi:hypothetical protein
VEADPIGLTDGNSLYAYVGANPITRTDAKGLEWNPFKIFAKVLQTPTQNYGQADNIINAADRGDRDQVNNLIQQANTGAAQIQQTLPASVGAASLIPALVDPGSLTDPVDLTPFIGGELIKDQIIKDQVKSPDEDQPPIKCDSPH